MSRESTIEKQCRLHIQRLYRGELMKWVSPGNAGVPDRILFLPNGVVAFIEFKRPGEELEPLQAWWQRRLTKDFIQHHRVVYAFDDGFKRWIAQLAK